MLGLPMSVWGVRKKGSLTIDFLSKLGVFMRTGILQLVGAVWRCPPGILHFVLLYPIARFIPNALLKLPHP